MSLCLTSQLFFLTQRFAAAGGYSAQEWPGESKDQRTNATVEQQVFQAKVSPQPLGHPCSRDTPVQERRLRLSPQQAH